MEKDLNKLEQAIINEIIEFNKKEYPSIKTHISSLRIKSREVTGVGRYVHFEYFQEELGLPINNLKDACLSSDKSLELDTLEYSINYELNITKGKFDFLELVTNGESWNGKYETFDLIMLDNNS